MKYLSKSLFIVLFTIITLPATTHAFNGSYDATSYTIEPNEQFTVVLDAQDLVNAGSVDLVIEFDPTYLSYVSTVAGPLMAPISSYGILAFTDTALSDPALMELIITVPSEDNIFGSGELLTVTFEATDTEGDTTLNVIDMTMLDADTYEYLVSDTLPSADVHIEAPAPVTPSGAFAVTTFTDMPVNTEFDVTLLAQDLVNAASVDFVVEFDPTYLSYVDTVAGPLMEPISSFGILAFTDTAVSDPSLMELIISVPSDIAITGGGELATITFTTNDMEGDTTLTIIDMTAMDFTTFDIIPISTGGPATVNIIHPDTTAPVRSTLAPSGVLVTGTTETTLSLDTDEVAVCHYSDAVDTTFDNGTPFDSSNNTSHSTTVTGLTDGTAYTYFVRCRDESGNTNEDDAGISFSIEETPDTDAPIISNTQPTGVLAHGTTQTNLTVDTDEVAQCRYSDDSQTSFESATVFSNTDALSHSTNVSGLTDGTSYNYFVWCTDVEDNVSDATQIQFSVEETPDTTAPVRSTLAPSGVLVTGTTETTLSLDTDEVAVCHYSDAVDTTFDNGTPFDSSNNTSHSTTVTGLTDGTAYTYFVRCRDESGNTNEDDAGISFSIEETPDTDAPQRTALSPTGTLPLNTTETELSLETDEVGLCHFATSSDTLFVDGIPFANTSSTSHSTTITGLSNGTDYVYYVRCSDESGNTNEDDAIISFSIEAEPVVVTPPSSGGGGGGGSSSSRDTSAPLRTSVIINDGDRTTTARMVTLALTARDRSEPITMQINEANTFDDDGVWIEFTKEYSFLLTSGNGKKTVYVRFKDDENNISRSVSDSIELQQDVKNIVVPDLPTDTESTAMVKGASRYTFRGNMGIGTDNPEVVELQKRLRSEGFFTYPTNTGYYGTITAEAVRKYQAKYGIDTTGFVGPLTRKQLNSSNPSTNTDSEVSLETFVRLLLALGIIPEEKADTALAALKLI